MDADNTNEGRAMAQAQEINEATAEFHKRFNAGLEATPGQPFVDRTPPSTAKIREYANAIRKRQGLPPLPEIITEA